MYDYRAAIREDIREYLEQNAYSNAIKARIAEDYDELYDELFDTLFLADSVTGNASGSYTFSAYQAEEYLLHNMDLYFAALDEFGCTHFPFDKWSPETADVTIRCYLLGEVLADVLDEYA